MKKVSDDIKEIISKNRKECPSVNGVTFEDVSKFLHSYGLTYLPELKEIVKSLEKIENSYDEMDRIMEEDADIWRELADR